MEDEIDQERVQEKVQRKFRKKIPKKALERKNLPKERAPKRLNLLKKRVQKENYYLPLKQRKGHQRKTIQIQFKHIPQEEIKQNHDYIINKL